jgi:Asp/Glu/hydantoin racemase
MRKNPPVVGMLLLDCSLFDIPGCGECDDTYPFVVKRRIIRGATVERMTSGSGNLLETVLDTARELEVEGVDAIMGNCGFLSLFQKDLQKNVSVPVITSCLLLVPIVSRMIPHGRRVGILTYRSDTLTEAHFRGAGWSSREIPVAIVGVEDQNAWRLFRTPEHPFHSQALERELLEVSRRLIVKNPDVGALVLECTVMPVFGQRIQEETGLPVFDITLLASMMVESLWRKPFEKKL